MRVGGATLGILMPCIDCGHRNRLPGPVKAGYKAFIKNELPKCRRCGRQLDNGDCEFKRTKTFIEAEKEVKKELRGEGGSSNEACHTAYPRFVSK